MGLIAVLRLGERQYLQAYLEQGTPNIAKDATMLRSRAAALGIHNTLRTKRAQLYQFLRGRRGSGPRPKTNLTARPAAARQRERRSTTHAAQVGPGAAPMARAVRRRRRGSVRVRRKAAA